MDKKKLTLICVGIAGLIFLPAVILNKPWYGLAAAFFDWLPLFTGWMHFTKTHKIPILHIVLTVIAYIFFVAWLFVPHSDFARFAFIMIWFLAVVSGGDIQ